MEQNTNKPPYTFQRPGLSKKPINKSSVTDKPNPAEQNERAASTSSATPTRRLMERTERTTERSVSAPPVAGQDQDLEGLIERHRELVRQRDKLTYQQTEAARKLEACVAEAKRLGINSLEEMREKIAELQAIDQEAKESFAQNLNAEEKLQSHIAEQLKNMDNE